MLEFVLSDAPRRLICRNPETFRLLWPLMATHTAPAARPLCRWASRRGAAVHGALRLRHTQEDNGLVWVATREVLPGTPLVSVPLGLAIHTSRAEARRYASREHPDARLAQAEELANLVLRHMHHHRSEYKAYVSFLDRQRRLRASVDAPDEDEGAWIGTSGSRPAASQTLQERVEQLRLQRAVRRLEQSLPHFAAKSAAWGISTVLTQGLEDDTGGLALIPLMDFCGRTSSVANARLVVTRHERQSRSVGVVWHDGSAPCAHLLATTLIPTGEVVSINAHRINTSV